MRGNNKGVLTSQRPINTWSLKYVITCKVKNKTKQRIGGRACQPVEKSYISNLHSFLRVAVLAKNWVTLQTQLLSGSQGAGGRGRSGLGAGRMRAAWSSTVVPALLGSLPQRSPLCPGWHVASPAGVRLHRVFPSSGKKQSCWIKLPSRPSNPSVTSHEKVSFLNKVTLCQPRGCGGENTGERGVGERAEQPESLAGCLSSRTL